MTFLPKPSPQSGHEKNIRQNSTGRLISTPQACQGHQSQGKSETLPKPRGALGDMAADCTVASCREPWHRERTLVENQGTLGQVRTLINDKCY